MTDQNADFTVGFGSPSTIVLPLGSIYYRDRKYPKIKKQIVGGGVDTFFRDSPGNFKPIRIPFGYAVVSWNGRRITNSGRNRANRNSIGRFSSFPQYAPKLLPNSKS